MRVSTLLLAVAVAGTALPAPAADRSGVTWGKPNVSLADYRGDAIACARQAAAVDVSGTEAAKVLITASTRIDNASNPAEIADDVAAARPDRQFKEVSDIQHRALADCLTSHGYQRFRLTAAQRKHLAKLPTGSDVRRAFLHHLASDPDVLAAQTVSDDR
jgi:hypothetical protein